MENYLRLQRLLMGIKESYCKGNAAELSRSIKKDPSYVNRLFYPAGKKGAKGIGPDIMNACKDAFPLPKGFWDMQPDEAFPTGMGKTEGSSATQAQDLQAQQKPSASIASRPNIEATTPGAVVTLAQALEVISDRLNTLTDERRAQAAQRLQTLALAPDSQKARNALLAMLEDGPAPVPLPETKDFAPPVPSGKFSKTREPS